MYKNLLYISLSLLLYSCNGPFDDLYRGVGEFTEEEKRFLLYEAGDQVSLLNSKTGDTNTYVFSARKFSSTSGNGAKGGDLYGTITAKSGSFDLRLSINTESNPVSFFLNLNTHTDPSGLDLPDIYISVGVNDPIFLDTLTVNNILYRNVYSTGCGLDKCQILYFSFDKGIIKIVDDFKNMNYTLVE